MVEETKARWKLASIAAVYEGGLVTLASSDHSLDGISYKSPCFRDARVGDLWAVKHDQSRWLLGGITTAILLERVEHD